MDFGALDILSALIAQAQSFLDVVADVGLRLGSAIATIALLLGLSIRIAGGAQGTVGHVLSWIIQTGLILGALSFWPRIASESFATAEEIVRMTTGAELSALDVLERGFDWHARIWEHAMAGSIWIIVQSLFAAMSMGTAALLVLGAHIVVSLVLAASILQFWLGAAILPLAIPFFFVPGLQGIGGQAFAFMVAATLRLIFLGVIIGAIREVFLDIALPDFQETITVTDVFAAGLASVVAGYLAWVSSTWASVLTRGAVGSTSVTSILASAAILGAGVRGTGIAPAGAAQAGSAATASASSLEATSGSARGASGRAGAGPRPDSGVVGRLSRP
jgi:TrbL/VirB6 plasmid conjugal transfer protein